VDDPARLALLDTLSAPGRARAGMVALLGLAGLACTSVWRRRLGLSFERWRAAHLACTAAAVGGAFVHVMWVDSYSSAPAVRWSVLALVLAAALALFWSRVAHPYATASRPYRVLAAKPERGNAVTLELAAEGHEGLRFEPGQFARIRLADDPYGLDDHPFTLSSSADRPERPAFTVKALGDFSSSLAEIPAGAPVLVDGPHGGGVGPCQRTRGCMLVAAGIGITPAMSVLRTAVERGDHRRLLLVYGSRRWADVTFREELAQLEGELPNLTTVVVLSRPERGWRAERGRVGEDLLRRFAPRDVARWSALVCGPAPMVSEATSALVRMGMSRAAIQAEGFE
jgi:predicted ferric reductase